MNPSAPLETLRRRWRDRPLSPGELAALEQPLDPADPLLLAFAAYRSGEPTPPPFDWARLQARIAATTRPIIRPSLRTLARPSTDSPHPRHLPRHLPLLPRLAPVAAALVLALAFAPGLLTEFGQFWGDRANSDATRGTLFGTAAEGGEGGDGGAPVVASTPTDPGTLGVGGWPDGLTPPGTLVSPPIGLTPERSPDLSPTPSAELPGDGGDARAAQAALDAARARWAVAGPGGTTPVDYGFTLTRVCYCIPEWAGPFLVTVRDGVTAITHDTDGDGTWEPVDPVIREALPASAEALYRFIEERIGQAGFRALYDPLTGLPQEFWSDPIPEAADDELGLQISGISVER